MTIQVPNNNLSERIYTIDILLGEFLGLTYDVEISQNTHYTIILDNTNQLIIEDHFFNNYPNELRYLHVDSIPKEISFYCNPFTKENDIPAIFGSDTFNITKHQIHCGIDIFASSFFMLSRWEEYVNPNRDEHHRFWASESLAYKNDFLHRPIVNEYTQMLWNMLLHLGYKEQRKKRNYQLFLTHDVDVITKYRHAKSGLHEIFNDLFKRKNIPLAIKNLFQKLKVHLKIEQDPFDTFEYLMDVSEKLGVKSYFFFMAHGLTQYDNAYNSSSPTVSTIAKNILDRGHHIGIHPSYNAYNDPDQFAKEKAELEENFHTAITFARAHFLRFEVPTTWQIEEDNAMEWDTTLSFSEHEGFRCGVCYRFSVFNILSRKKLHVKERPLLVMDASFATYQPHLECSDVEQKIRALMRCVKSYDGEFVILWHNSSFNTQQWKKYATLYEKVLLS